MGKFWKLIGKGLAKAAAWALEHPELLDVIKKKTDSQK
jgi:hypothetical protein